MPAEVLSSKESEGVRTFKARLRGFETDEGRSKGLAFQPAPDDVFIVTPPKCGTTLVSQMCHQLRTGGDMDFEEITSVVPWVEIAYDLALDLEVPQKATPRLFKSHLWYEHCPKGGRYVVITRDPTAAAVSFFTFLQNWIFPEGDVSVDQFVLEFWLQRGRPTSPMQNASYFHLLASWYERRHDPNVLWLHYEHIVQDLESTARLLGEFLGLEPDEALLDKAVRMSSREFMVQQQDRFDEKLTKRYRNASLGLPPDAGGQVFKVKPIAEKPTLSPAAEQAILAKWREVVEPVTGFATYQELLQSAKTPAAYLPFTKKAN